MKLYVCLLLLIVTFVLVGCNSQSVDELRDEEIKVGVTLPLTGNLAFIGVPAKQGAELAEMNVNQNGGINGKEFNILFSDNTGDTKAAISDVTKFINVDRVSGIITLFTHITAAVSPITHNSKVPLIYSSTITTFASSSKFTFQDYNNFERDTKVLAAKLIYEGIESVIIVQPSIEAYEVFVTSFVESYTSLGGEVKYIEKFEMNEQDFSSLMEKVKTHRNDEALLIATGFPQHTIPLLNKIQELGLDNWQTIIPLCAFPQTLEAVGYIMKSTQTICTWFSYSEEDVNAVFFSQYVETYGDKPDYTAAYVYDQTMILANALKKCDVLDDLSGECVSDMLLQTQNYNGVSSVVSFDEEGISYRPTNIFRFGKNGREQLSG